jgi:hypothetical protein
VLLEVAAGLLVLAAVLALAAFANRRAGLVTGARLTGALGTGLLAGVIGTRLLDAQQVTQQVAAETVRDGDSISFTTQLGLWLPVGAAGLALLATLALLLRGRATAARLEPATPPMGVRLPYGTAPHQQYQAQPGTGPQPVVQQQPATGPQPVFQQQPAYQQQPSGYQQQSGYHQPIGTPPHGSPAPAAPPYEPAVPPLAQTPTPPAETLADSPVETPLAPAQFEPGQPPKGDEGDAARN